MRSSPWTRSSPRSLHSTHVLRSKPILDEQRANYSWYCRMATSQAFSRSIPDACVRRLCHMAGFEPEIALHVGDLVSLTGLIAAGLGICFVPAALRRIGGDRIVVRPFADTMERLDLWMIRHRDARGPALHSGTPDDWNPAGPSPVTRASIKQQGVFGLSIVARIGLPVWVRSALVSTHIIPRGISALNDGGPLIPASSAWEDAP